MVDYVIGGVIALLTLTAVGMIAAAVIMRTPECLHYEKRTITSNPSAPLAMLGGIIGVLAASQPPKTETAEVCVDF